MLRCGKCRLADGRLAFDLWICSHHRPLSVNAQIN